MNYRYLYIFTIIYFLLPMVNILFAYAALACFALPFILLKLTKRKAWCRGICPRAGLLSRLKFLSRGSVPPEWLIGKKMRRNVLTYFGINLFFIAMSTIMVSIGRMAPIDKIRLLILFQLPFGLPELFPLPSLPAPAIHLGYRFYSMMATSALIGMVLALLYKTRTWCAVCPINSISSDLLEKAKKEQSP